MDFTKISNGAKFTLGRCGFLLKKYSPDICLGAGVILLVGGAVKACINTLELEEVIDKGKERIDNAKDLAEIKMNDDGDEIIIQNRKALAVAYAKTGFDIVKLYSLPAGAMVLGISSIVCGRNIMTNRQMAIVAAYETIDKAYRHYRERVIDMYGEDKDREIIYGTKKKKIEVESVNEDGEIIEEKKKVEILPEDINPSFSQYAVIFDDANPNWNKNPLLNKTWLVQMQQYFNNLLKARGHVFLNEVYEQLGFEHTSAGAVVGWIYGGFGDDYIDFGIFNETYKPARDFVNGYNNAVILDFNVDGVIYNQI